MNACRYLPFVGSLNIDATLEFLLRSEFFPADQIDVRRLVSNSPAIAGISGI